MLHRIQQWLLVTFFLAPWVLLPVMPIIAAVMWICGLD